MEARQCVCSSREVVEASGQALAQQTLGGGNVGSLYADVTRRGSWNVTTTPVSSPVTVGSLAWPGRSLERAHEERVPFARRRAS